jgi:hypothetical protein
MQDIDTMIEGWLKKKKSDSRKHFFSNFTKRWFTLDIKNALFSYSSAQNKKSKKDIPLREFVDVKELDFSETQPKDWGYEFCVITKDRTYQLFAQTEEFKKMWVKAFQTILELKNPDKKQKKRKSKKKKKKEKSSELDIDSIVKKGPQDTVQLESVLHLEGIQEGEEVFTNFHNNGGRKKLPSLFAKDFGVNPTLNISNDFKQLQDTRASDPNDYCIKSESSDVMKSETFSKHSSDRRIKNISGEEHYKKNSEPFEKQKSKQNKNSEQSFDDDWDEDEDYGSLNDLGSCLLKKENKSKSMKYPVMYPSRVLQNAQ